MQSINKNEYTVSVIVPIYNVEEYIDKCIESIINQTYENLEIILIDDGSTDKCPEICDAYAIKDKRIKVIHKENGGLSSARNSGLDICSGDYIAFVDGDDWIEPNTYEQMLKVLISKNVDIVYYAVKKVYSNGKEEICFRYYDNEVVLSAKEVVKDLLLDKIGSQVWKCLYKKHLWNNVRFPVGRLYEDIATTFRVCANAKTVSFTDTAFYNYRINNTSISYSPNPSKRYHIYFGFREHYEYAKINFPEISDECCALAGHYALSTYFYYCRLHDEQLKQYIGEVKEFLKTNKKTILKSKNLKFSLKFALRVFCFSDKLFRIMAKIIKI